MPAPACRDHASKGLMGLGTIEQGDWSQLPETHMHAWDVLASSEPH